MSYQQFRPQRFNILPPVVKNLLIINGLFFLATVAFGSQFNVDLPTTLGLHYVSSSEFSPFQIVSYMFMHGNMMHIFFNMFALWMFGNTLENYLGPKRFLIYYMITGIGAAIVQMTVSYLRLAPLYDQVSTDTLQLIMTEGANILQKNQNFIDPIAAEINSLINTPTVGASGAVFGILLAFGMLFPDTMLYIYFAIPIKAKYFVVLYGAMELYSGLSNNPGDNVAHFSHLGGMLFGFFLIKYWQKNSNSFY